MIKLQGMTIKFLIPTGASTTILNCRVYEILPTLHRPTLRPVQLNMLADGIPITVMTRVNSS